MRNHDQCTGAITHRVMTPDPLPGDDHHPAVAIQVRELSFEIGDRKVTAIRPRDRRRSRVAAGFVFDLPVGDLEQLRRFGLEDHPGSLVGLDPLGGGRLFPGSCTTP